MTKAVLTVTSAIVRRVREILAKHRILVWYDGEAVYSSFLEPLDLPEVTILRYQGSYLRLRHDLDPFIEGTNPGAVLVYVPVAREASRFALIEADLTGTFLAPGIQPRNRNSRLSVLAKEALGRGLLSDDLRQAIENAEKKGYRLDDLDRIAARSSFESGRGLEEVFATSNPIEAAIKFISDVTLDLMIASRGERPVLEALLVTRFGFVAAGSSNLAELRAAFCRHLLLNELSSFLSESDAASLPAFTHAAGKEASENIRALLSRWRDSDALRDAYAFHAGEIEKALPPEFAPENPAALVECDTLAAAERILLMTARARLAEGDCESGLSWSVARRSRFWVRLEPRIGLEWAYLASMAEVVKTADHVKSEAAERRTLEGIVKAYAGAAGSPGWARLDACHRRMRRMAAELDHDEAWTKVSVLARRRYDEAIVAQAAAMKSILSDANRSACPESLRQDHLFSRCVEPGRHKGRFAYLIVDALRFEMAEDLVAGIEGDVIVEPALAVAPTLTPLGMAALLPGAESGIEIAEKGGRLAARLRTRILATRQDRVRHLKTCCGEGFVDVRLEELLSERKSALTKVATAGFLFVTSQEIDLFSEEDHDTMARRVMEAAIADIRRAIRRLVEWGYETIAIVADHGFLLDDRAEADEIIDPPGGQTLELHRRVWIGRGGANSVGTMRLAPAARGTGGDYDVVVPEGCSVFRAGGGLTYHHGGVTLQERVVPFIVIRGRAKTKDGGRDEVSIQFDRTRGVRTRVFSVRVALKSLVHAVRRVRVLGRHGREAVAEAVTAEYGFLGGSREIELKANEEDVVTLHLKTEVHKVTLEVRDAESDALLASMAEIPVKLEF